MKDMGALSPGKIRNGDIIFWEGHAGVFLYGWFYQSNGNKKKPGCDNNLQRNKGPRMIPLAEVLGYGLGSYKVFRVVHESEFTLKIENKHKESCGFDGLTYYDAVEMDVRVKDKDVTVSNIVNQVPTITPSTISVFTCTLTCLPGSTGELNVVSGSGEVSQAPNPNGDYSFSVNLADSATGAGFLSTMQCPDEDPIIGNGQPYDYTSSWHFILTDSIQTQNPSSNYGVFVRLAPKY